MQAAGNPVNNAVKTSTTTSSIYINDSINNSVQVIQVSNDLSQKEIHLINARNGLTTSTSGPNNLTTTWQYDGLGRTIVEGRSDGTYTTTKYMAASSMDAIRIRSHGAAVSDYPT